jgi:YfiR/HmsC-like
MRKFALLCVAALAALPPLATSALDDPAALEQKVKAAFLYKFPGYVEWPENAFATADTPVAIGVIGDDPLAAELAQVVAGRSLDGRAVSVRRLKEADSPAGLHVLFVGSAERARLAQLVKEAPTQPMLIVAEFDGALNRGSAINFVISSGRVRFEVALDNAEKRGLKLSSRLLTVAQSVRTGAPP